MFRPRLSTEFPLLTKELVEQAMRPRTYWVRFLYASLLFTAGLIVIYGTTGGRISSSARLGEGRAVFLQVVELQALAIVIFLPAITAGALAAEKERDSLTLLLLTTMRPWAIVLQKLASRVIPMLSFLLLSFPLMAVAYSFGGVTTEELLAAAFILVFGVIEIGAIALMCSAYCRTTAEALLATYGVLFCLWLFVPPALVLLAIDDTQHLFARAFLGSCAIILSLGLALVFLHSRAFVPPRNLLLEWFKRLDRFFDEANTITGGVILVHDGDPYPDTRPVAWRETAKKSLGTFRYLFRVLVVLELPILFLGQGVNVSLIKNENLVSLLLYIVWVIAGVMVCVHAASVVSGERSRQTLDVLLTTPISGRELLMEKLAGVRRLLYVLAVPFLSIHLFQVWFRPDMARGQYFLESVATLAIFLPTLTWFATWCGLKNPRQMRAVFITLGSVALWCAWPAVLTFLLTRVGGISADSPLEFLQVFSPAAVIAGIERQVTPPPDEWQWTWPTAWAFSLLLHGAIGWRIRQHCLQHADELLGRVVEGSSIETAAIEPVPVAQVA